MSVDDILDEWINVRRLDATRYDRLLDRRVARTSTREFLDRPTDRPRVDDPRADGVMPVDARAGE